MATRLADGVLTLNGVDYTKNDLSFGENSSSISIQSITIENQQNLKEYPIYGYNPDWTYKIYLGTMGDLDVVMQTNPNYRYTIKDSKFYLYDYDWNGPKTFLIIGVSP